MFGHAAGYLNVNITDTSNIFNVMLRTDEQSEEMKASIPDQIETCKSYIEEKGWDLLEIYQDEISGGTLERPGLQIVLDLAEEKMFDVLVVYDTHRLHRGMVSTIIDYLLVNNDVEIHYTAPGKQKIVNRATDEDEDAGVRYDIDNLVDGLERRRIKRRLYNARYQKAKRGDPRAGIGAFPYGRIWDGEKFVLDRGKANTLKAIAERYLAGESLIQLAKEFKLNYPSLIRYLSSAAQDKWKVQFKGMDKEPEVKCFSPAHIRPGYSPPAPPVCLLPLNNKSGNIGGVKGKKNSPLPPIQQPFPAGKHGNKQQYIGQNNHADIPVGLGLKRQGLNDRAHCEHEENVKDV